MENRLVCIGHFISVEALRKQLEYNRLNPTPAKYLDIYGLPIKNSKGVSCPPGNSPMFSMEMAYWKAVYEGKEYA